MERTEISSVETSVVLGSEGGVETTIEMTESPKVSGPGELRIDVKDGNNGDGSEINYDKACHDSLPPFISHHHVKKTLKFIQAPAMTTPEASLMIAKAGDLFTAYLMKECRKVVDREDGNGIILVKDIERAVTQPEDPNMRDTLRFLETSMLLAVRDSIQPSTGKYNLASTGRQSQGTKRKALPASGT